MAPQSSLLAHPPATHPLTLGVVSFLNARPLHEHLAGRDGVLIRGDVPSQLGLLLDDGHCDVALLPIVDSHARRGRLELISDACIASDGETMTVRVFSRIPPDKVRRLHVDGDSHTSIVLAQVIWRELYGTRLELVPLEPARRGEAAGSAESVLLIGDKVVREAPRGFGFEVDLGAAWKHLTDLPFVFAAWYAKAGGDHVDAARLLCEARDAGIADAGSIARRAAAAHGWPEEAAVKYLCGVMRYTLSAPMRMAMERFFTIAERHGLLA